MGEDKRWPSASLEGDAIDEVERRLEKSGVDREPFEHRVLVTIKEGRHDVVEEKDPLWLLTDGWCWGIIHKRVAFGCDSPKRACEDFLWGLPAHEK